MSKLFGTDGIRGKVGDYPLSPEILFLIGKATGLWIKRHMRKTRAVVGRDTRASGANLEDIIIAGLNSAGVGVFTLDVFPTPAVAFFVRKLDTGIGLMISASHNRDSDNGIKFFERRGYKLSDSDEASIESIIKELEKSNTKITTAAVQKSAVADSQRIYLDFLKTSVANLDLKGMKIVVDCAFGANCNFAPRILEKLGASVISLNASPDGTNINLNCGTLHPEFTSQAVIKEKADLGICFDGDGDRVIIVDNQGKILDGDYIMAILSRAFAEAGRLKNNLLVTTHMSNVGLEIAMKSAGIRMIRASVGDKYVLKAMLEQDASLGGEQSGHIICLDYVTTGDGLLTALLLLKIFRQKQRSLAKLAGEMQKFPQILVNLRIKEKKPFERIPGYSESLKSVRGRLGKNSRILVRYSGTEPLARIMLEGEDESLIKETAQQLKTVIAADIGDR